MMAKLKNRCSKDARTREEENRERENREGERGKKKVLAVVLVAEVKIQGKAYSSLVPLLKTYF